MARTINEIYDIIIQEKETRTNLNGLTPDPETSFNLLDQLTSGSLTAVWRLWAYVTAVCIHIHEVQFDLFKVEVNETLDRSVAGSSIWWQTKLEEFQYTDQLELIDGQFQYSVIDTSKQIIKRVAVQELTIGGALIKVAKQVDLSPGPLDSDELAAVTSYMRQLKIPGTKVGVISLDADVVLPVYDIYYDPIIPLSQVQTNCQIATVNFFAGLTFDGKFFINKLTDALQVAIGVDDPVFVSCSVTPDGGQSLDISISYLPASGYFQLGDIVQNLYNFIPIQ